MKWEGNDIGYEHSCLQYLVYVDNPRTTVWSVNQKNDQHCFYNNNGQMTLLAKENFNLELGLATS